MLSGTAGRYGLEQTFPDQAERLSILQALQSKEIAFDEGRHRTGIALSDRMQLVIQQVRTFAQIGKCPVVGITGMLNSGKSSLLATYLSEQGRRRVLRGVGNEQGTHRYVLWLPSRWWQQPDLLASLTKYLSSIFGSTPEQLSDDPQVAFAQYNGQVVCPPAVPAARLSSREGVECEDSLRQPIDSLSIPLLASDDALNELGIGLLDCPDIQTGFVSSHSGMNQSADRVEMDEQRRKHLARVGRVCSAFIVVTKFSSLHDEGLTQILAALRDAMPGVPRLLAVNRIKARYGPQIVAEQSQGLMDRFAISRLFLAYDYRSHLANTRIPTPPPRMPLAAGEPLPIFFEQALQHQSSMQPESTNYLLDLAQRLDAGMLERESRRSLCIQLEDLTAESLEWIHQCNQAREEMLSSAWQVVAQACLDFMVQRDAAGEPIGLRLQTSPAIIGQMSDSLIRQAPWSMRMSLKIDRRVRELQQAIVSGASRFQLLQSMSSNVGQLMRRIRHGEAGQVVTAARLAKEIRRLDVKGCFQRLGDSELCQASEEALARFKNEDQTRLSVDNLDKWSKALWNEMPLKKKLYVGTMPLAPIFAPLLAVTLVPFDGGGSAVLVFASLKELLAAAGIAAIATTTLGGQETTDMIEREAGWTQLSELFSLTCDCLGLRRPNSDQLPVIEFAASHRKLSPVAVPVKAIVSRVAIPLWRVADQFEQMIRSTTYSLRSDLSES